MTRRVRIGFAIAATAIALWTLHPAAPVFAQARSGQFDQRAMFRVVGAMYGLDPDLLAAIARVESGGRSGAISRAGAQGLMQLMPATAARYQVANPFDPVQNTLGAARYIAQMRSAGWCAPEARWSLAQMLAAYNAGEGAVCRWDGIPPYPETRDYVGRVLWIYLTGPPPTHPPAAKATVRIQTLTAPPRRSADLTTLEQLDELRRARAESARSASQESITR